MADYLYGGAYVRALENAIIGRDRIARLLEAQTPQEAYETLAEYGVRLIRDKSSGAVLREETLLGILKGAYATIEELASDSGALMLWKYPYDCNNVKAAIKCFVRGIDPTPMMFDFGTLGASDVIRMVKEGQYDALPAEMGRAAVEASAAFAKTRNPQVVDLILDRACYGDMLAAAKASKNAFVTELVRVKIDLVNVMILLRVLRMNNGEAGKALARDAMLAGGELPEALLKELTEGDEALLWRSLSKTGYESFAEAFLASDGSLTAAERLADNFFMEKLLEMKFTSVGLDAMVAFLLAHEYEVRNLRIVLAGREAGLNTETIRERIRDSYV